MSVSVVQVAITKAPGEILGLAVVESGWGSILPTVVVANLLHGGPAERCGELSIGDRIMSVNGTSMVGLPITTCQNIIRVRRERFTLICKHNVNKSTKGCMFEWSNFSLGLSKMLSLFTEVFEHCSCSRWHCFMQQDVSIALVVDSS